MWPARTTAVPLKVLPSTRIGGIFIFAVKFSNGMDELALRFALLWADCLHVGELRPSGCFSFLGPGVSFRVWTCLKDRLGVTPGSAFDAPEIQVAPGAKAMANSHALAKYVKNYWHPSSRP